MNLTITALVTSSFLSYSPVFVSNQLSFSNCRFERFFPRIFYQSNSLHLENSHFQHGLGEVMWAKDGDELHPTLQNKTFTDITFGPDDLKLKITKLAVTQLFTVFSNK